MKGHLVKKIKKNKKRYMGDFSASYSGVVLLVLINLGGAFIKWGKVEIKKKVLWSPTPCLSLSNRRDPTNGVASAKHSKPKVGNWWTRQSQRWVTASHLGH